jgi:nucleoid DNA-binding protein
MTKTYINKAEIAQGVASNAGLTKTKTLKIIEQVESEIIFALKTKGQVKIIGFGTFYFLKRASRTIKSVRTKSTRLLLERNELKFRASKFFKNELLGIPNIPKRPRAPAMKTKPIEVPVKVGLSATAQKPKSPFKFKPLAILPRVDGEKMKKRILERMMRLAGKPEMAKSVLEIDLPTAVNLSKTMEDKIFATLLRQVIKNGLDNIHLTLGDAPQVEVSAGRPKKRITRIPTDIVRKFIENRLEITHFGAPQERQMHLIIASKPRLTLNLKVYMLPNLSGASLYFKISQVRVYNTS